MVGRNKHPHSLSICPPSQLGFILEGQGTDIERIKANFKHIKAMILAVAAGNGLMQPETPPQTALRRGQLSGTPQQPLPQRRAHSCTAERANTSSQHRLLVQTHRNPAQEFCSISRSVSVARARDFRSKRSSVLRLW